jgi:HemY protein
MIRVVLFLVFVSLAALGAAWLADRPGEVTIVWLGRRIETSIMVAAASAAIMAALSILLWSLLRLLLRSPRLISRASQGRRRSKAYQAISKGLIAVGAGDTEAARKFAAEANRLARAEPLTLLLSAQTAQLSGDRPAAERIFRDMAARSDTRLFGLRGLYIEAQRREDTLAARHYAEEAAGVTGAPAWAAQALLESQCGSGDWAGALTTLESSWRGGLIDRAAYRRKRAVLLTARALALSEIDPGEARALAVEAVRLAPDLVPAAALAGRLLAEAGETRRAAKLIETAWRAGPHPDLAEVYAYLKPGDSTRDRLARVEALAHQLAGHVEGAIAVARAAIDAREFAAARAALAPLTSQPTRRVASLMAELEQVEHGDEGRAREWMARALRAPPGPVWSADGFVSDRWLPISPVTGRLDAFQWRTPVAGVAGDGPLIEDAAHGAEASERAAPDKSGSPQAAAAGEETGAVGVPAAAASPTGDRAEAPAPAPRKPQPPVETVIPLVHAPDDPGPEPEPKQGLNFDGRRGLRLFFR